MDILHAQSVFGPWQCLSLDLLSQQVHVASWHGCRSYVCWTVCFNDDMMDSPVGAVCSVLKSGLVWSFVFFWGNWTATSCRNFIFFLDCNRNRWQPVATSFYEDQLHTYKSQELVHKSRTLSLCISIMFLICVKQQVFQPPSRIFGTHIENPHFAHINYFLDLCVTTGFPTTFKHFEHAYWESSFCAFQVPPWYVQNKGL